MPSRRPPRDRVAAIIATALVADTATAAATHRVSERTVRRHVSEFWRGSPEPEMAELVHEKRVALAAAVDRDWRDEAIGFMKAALGKARQLVEEAQPEQLRDVMGAIKIVGELDVVRRIETDGELVEVDQSSSAQGGPAPRLRAVPDLDS